MNRNDVLKMPIVAGIATWTATNNAEQSALAVIGWLFAALFSYLLSQVLGLTSDKDD